MPPPSPSTFPPAAASSLYQRLQQLQAACGAVYDNFAPAPSTSGPLSDAAAAKKKKLDHRERSRLEHLATEQVNALYQECFASSSTKVQLANADLELLLRLLPSLTALSAPPTSQTPLLMIVVRVLHPQKNDAALPQVSDAVLSSVLLSLAHLLHLPDPWAAGQAPSAVGIRATAAGLLAQLLRFFVAHAQEAAVEAQWRQWQELANNALLNDVRTWLEEADAQREHDSHGVVRQRSSPAKASPASPSSAECVLCQLVDLVDAVVEHPCTRSLPSDTWPPVLSAVAHLAGSPQEAPQHLTLSCAVLQTLTHVREKGVVSPGVWRQVALDVLAKSVPHGPADAPSPLPVSPLATSSVTYATLYLKYVHFTKSLMLLAVEESSADSSAARDTAAQLHAVLAGLVELSASVFLATPAAGGRVSLLAAVVKDLLTVREESRSAPRQYARYVEGMLAGSTPLVLCNIQALATECHSQTTQLADSVAASVLAANAEVLQGVYVWSIHAVVDEGLLDSTRRAAVAAALPWTLYDAAEATLGQLSERLALVLVTSPMLSARKDVPLLAARVIACEGLALLLRFVLFVVALYGTADEISWNVRFRNRLYAAETRIMRIVGAFDCGPPQVLRAFTDALDRMSSILGPTAAKVSALLPNSTRPALVSAGCHGALDKLLEVIPIF